MCAQLMQSSDNMNMEEIEDKLNSSLRKRDKAIIELNNINKELDELLELKFLNDPKMVKIKCIQCGGMGRVKQENGNQVICPTCKGNEYVWLEAYIPKQEEDTE